MKNPLEKKWGNKSSKCNQGEKISASAAEFIVRNQLKYFNSFENSGVVLCGRIIAV
jgi:hypothetical protein